MRFEGYDDELPDEEEIIDEFLGENPRARELRLMRAALEQRREGLQREQERTQEPRERAQLQAKIAELDRQIDAADGLGGLFRVISCVIVRSVRPQGSLEGSMTA